MEHDVTTTYLLSGKASQRVETIAGKRQQVQTWNKWCIAINSARSADIISSVKGQNWELYSLLTENPQKAESFFDELAFALQTKIQKTQQDVNEIEFDFEGDRVYLSNLVPPGTVNEIEHYYWCVER